MFLRDAKRYVEAVICNLLFGHRNVYSSPSWNVETRFPRSVYRALERRLYHLQIDRQECWDDCEDVGEYISPLFAPTYVFESFYCHYNKYKIVTLSSCESWLVHNCITEETAFLPARRDGGARSVERRDWDYAAALNECVKPFFVEEGNEISNILTIRATL